MLFDWLTTTLPLAGKLFDTVGAPIALISGFAGVGIFLGSVHAWISKPEPDWAGGAGRGGIVGGLVGVLAAAIDTAFE